MEFSEDELKLEFLVETIQLTSSAIKCEVCKSGQVVTVGRETPLVLYTREGSQHGVEQGITMIFFKNGSSKIIDALRKDFLVT